MYTREREHISSTLARASLKITTEDIAEKELETQVHVDYRNAQAASAKMKKI